MTFPPFPPFPAYSVYGGRGRGGSMRGELISHSIFVICYDVLFRRWSRAVWWMAVGWMGR